MTADAVYEKLDTASAVDEEFSTADAVCRLSPAPPSQDDGEAMTADELAKFLADKEVNFLAKLKRAGLNELVYWEGGGRPENLPKEMLERYLRGLDERRELIPHLEVRKSPAGKYGKTGFEWVFVFEDSFKVMGIEQIVYVKGFFFEIDLPRGVEIQSFKKSRPKLKSVR